MIIKRFDPIIYPIVLWVAISKDVSKVLNSFTTWDSMEISMDILNHANANSIASTWQVMDKTSKEMGALIIFSSKKELTTGIIAHESCHAAKIMCDKLGIDILSDEPFEYLLGWIADCCEELKRDKSSSLNTTK